ncbi:hydrogenase nickel incorporation protein HypB [Marinobacter caseinilyticus]|uniref:hydrogenase nickel incorporation protein HypB n=1 Tax=Marinobacter caseinilyticus TaxID=2692195 RepID=UPI00140BFC73|nr:hydrogenase nickel incorporation protein HypB [Marinobacter caseinilyticus]
MCTTCGCSKHAHAWVTDLATGKVTAIVEPVDHDHARIDHRHTHPTHHHAHPHDHSDSPAHDHSPNRPHTSGTTIDLEQEVLAKNNRLAERNRGWLEGRNILALNLVSSPGAGKTQLLERTIHDLQNSVPISVVEGDQETVFDAERIGATGCRVVQVNTGTGCHLDASMLARALTALNPPRDSLVMVENVGNLVCPALFDLGEQAKVAILSVTEGTDKPLKYPHMFRASSLMVVNKIDLLPYVDFDLDACIAFARKVNPDIDVIPLSATRGDGLDRWYAWLNARLTALFETAS